MYDRHLSRFESIPRPVLQPDIWVLIRRETTVYFLENKNSLRIINAGRTASFIAPLACNISANSSSLSSTVVNGGWSPRTCSRIQTTRWDKVLRTSWHLHMDGHTHRTDIFIVHSLPMAQGRTHFATIECFSLLHQKPIYHTFVTVTTAIVS